MHIILSLFVTVFMYCLCIGISFATLLHISNKYLHHYFDLTGMDEILQAGRNEACFSASYMYPLIVWHFIHCACHPTEAAKCYMSYLYFSGKWHVFVDSSYIR